MAAMPETGTLASLPATRRAIIVNLKQRGEARAEDLAQDLAITASAVRQHLGGLVANGFVDHREVKGTPGRPKHLYFLTPAAESLFPKSYGDLANEVLAIVGEEDPALLERVFARRRDRRIESARLRLGGLSDLEGRVAEVARILDEDGYLASWEAVGDGTFRITEHNCAVLGVAERYGHACSTEIEFLRTILPDAVVQRTAHMMAGARRCAYEIAPAGPTRRPHHSSPR